MENIWWNRISNPVLFIEDIVSTALDRKGAVLYLPQDVPWYEELFNLIWDKIRMEDGRGTFSTFESPEADIGKNLIWKFCKQEKRVCYRSTESAGKFLAESRDIVLNDQYLWVEGVTRKNYKEWVEFLKDYYKYIPEGQAPGVFLLIVRGEIGRRRVIRGVVSFDYSSRIQPFDSYIFCTMTASQLKIPEWKQMYLASLAAELCGLDVELCEAAVTAGDLFLEDPSAFLSREKGEKIQGKGEEKELGRRIWTIQIQQFYPLIESFRSEFIHKHHEEIDRCLPVENNKGDTIRDPEDVEIGLLRHLQGYLELTAEETMNLRMFWDARNRLSHLGVLSLSEIEGLVCGIPAVYTGDLPLSSIDGE